MFCYYLANHHFINFARLCHLLVDEEFIEWASYKLSSSMSDFVRRPLVVQLSACTVHFQRRWPLFIILCDMFHQEAVVTVMFFFTLFCETLSLYPLACVLAAPYWPQMWHSKNVNIIVKLKRYVLKAILISLYYSLIYPYLTYGCTLWGNNYNTPLSQIIKLRNKAVRVINDVPLMESITPHYVSLSLFKFPNNYR